MRLMTLLLVWLVLAGGLGCDKDNGSTPGGTVSLTGAGATFPDPLYQKWAADYFRVHPSVRINYQGIGSGGGIKQIIEKTVDFGASDGPMTDEQMKKAPGELLHVPMTMGAVVPLYNLGGVDKPLVFSGPVLADLFLGKISKWDDPRLAALNPGLSLPDRPVTIVHRSDGSGTTYIWTDYLSKVSSEWASGPGKSTTVNWPVGRGAKGNDGVAGDVKQNEGSLGYVELVYAANNNIAFGDVVNAAGKRIRASEQTVSAAAATLNDIPQDLRVSITNAPGDAAYPISSFTWMLLYKDQPEQAKGQALVEFLWWATHDGQAMAAPLHYAPLPREFTPLVEAKLRSVSVGGKPVVVAQR